MGPSASGPGPRRQWTPIPCRHGQPGHGRGAGPARKNAADSFGRMLLFPGPRGDSRSARARIRVDGVDLESELPRNDPDRQIRVTTAPGSAGPSDGGGSGIEIPAGLKPTVDAPTRRSESRSESRLILLVVCVLG